MPRADGSTLLTAEASQRMLIIGYADQRGEAAEHAGMRIWMLANAMGHPGHRQIVKSPQLWVVCATQPHRDLVTGFAPAWCTTPG